MRTLLISIFSVAIATSAMAAQPAPKMKAADFPGAWADNNPVPLSRALAEHGAHGCGVYYWKKSAAGRDVLIYCTRDFEHWQKWTAYLFEGTSGVVYGPLTPISGLAIPQVH